MANTSPLYYLSSTDTGQRILYNLLKNNPGLATEINAGALILSVNPGEEMPLSSPMSFLLSTPKGSEIVQMLPVQLDKIFQPRIPRPSQAGLFSNRNIDPPGSGSEVEAEQESNTLQ